MSKKKIHGYCDWGKPFTRTHSKPEMHTRNKSRIHQYKGNETWRGVKIVRYKQSGNDWAYVIRQTLIGHRGETTKFHLRYFEIAPSGYTSFEVHKHEHVVIGIQGNGICTVGKKKYSIGFLDILYIEPNVPHQLKNPFRKPFGFFCIVDARRDKPKILS